MNSDKICMFSFILLLFSFFGRTQPAFELQSPDEKVGTITNNDARTLKVPLNFLEKGRPLEATVYSDDQTVDTRTKVGIRKMNVNSETVMDVQLMASGGQAVCIKPLNL